MALLSLRSLCLGLVLSSFAGAAWGQANPNVPASPAGSTPAADVGQLRDQAQQEAAAGKTADAIRDYRQVLSQQPGWIEGWWNLGMLLYSANEFQDAQSPFGQVTALAPGFGNGWALLGLSEYETKNYDDALSHLERAQTLGIRDDDEIARVSSYHLALLRIRAGEFERAADLLKATFGNGAIPQQARIALGLATLRVPLLPQQVDPSREALLESAGKAAIDNHPQSFAALAQDHPDLPYLHLAWCRALAHAGKNEDAVKACLAETAISPKSALAWVELSHLQLLEGKKAKAARSAETAVRLAPFDLDARQALAAAQPLTVRPLKATPPAAESREPDSDVRTPEQRIVQLYANPENRGEASGEAGQAVWKQALQEYMAADYSHARTDLETWLAANPSNGTAWALLGLCEFQLHDDENALLHLDRGARLGLNASAQSLDQARYTYGILLVRARRFDEAESVLARISDQSEALKPKVRFALGLALLRRPQLPESVPAADTDLVESAGRIAALLQQSQYDKAFPQFQALLDRYPTAPFLHYAYGTALIAFSEFDQASAQMEAERSVSPRSELPCLGLASIALRQNNPAPALRWAQCALDLAPDSVDAHYLMGRAAMDTGDLTTAIQQLEVAKTLSPESPEIHFNLARAYARAKLPDKAAQEREVFTRLNAARNRPGHP